MLIICVNKCTQNISIRTFYYILISVYKCRWPTRTTSPAGGLMQTTFAVVNESTFAIGTMDVSLARADVPGALDTLIGHVVREDTKTRLRKRLLRPRCLAHLPQGTCESLTRRANLQVQQSSRDIPRPSKFCVRIRHSLTIVMAVRYF